MRAALDVEIAEEESYDKLVHDAEASLMSELTQTTEALATTILDGNEATPTQNGTNHRESKLATVATLVARLRA